MTREYRITTENVHPLDEGDCYMAPEDPFFQLAASSIMGGLGAQQRLAEYNDLTREHEITKITRQRVEAQAMGIKPGTPAWFALFPKA